MIVLHPYSARAEAGQAHLRFLETTDIHVNLLPYDYFADRPNDTMGLCPHRARSSMRSAPKRRTRCSSTTATSCRASPMGDYIAYERGMKAGDVHPVIKGMNVARLRMLDARQPRVQLRPRLHGEGAGRRQLPLRLRQPRQGRCSLPTRARTRSSSSPTSSSTSCSTDGNGDESPDQDRLHRLPAAADHGLGREASRRQGRTRDIVETARPGSPR